jgi:hypothetical protein
VGAVVVLGVLVGVWWGLAGEPEAPRALPAEPPVTKPAAVPPRSFTAAPMPGAEREPPVKTIVAIRCVSGPGGDQAYCDRWERDRRLRELIDDVALEPARARSASFTAAFEAAAVPCRSGAASCAAAAETALAAAGFADVEVRPSGLDDPLSRGVWAAAGRVAEACLVAGWDPIGKRWTNTPVAVGRRVDTGTCLAG